MGLDETAGAVLLLQCDGASATDEIERCAAVAEKHRATEVFHTSDEAEGAALMEARRVALTALEQLGTVLLDDVGVPVSVLPRMQARIEEVAARHEVTIGCFGHAGDGNLHPTIVYDAADPDATRRAGTAFEEILDAALDLGGTISGEHGIGQLKATYLGRQVGPTETALMRRIKHAFDPRGILNPGRGY
jgi:glycolate oxidase